MEMIKEGYIYFNDDDTVLHPELWENIKDLDENDFISFMQGNKGGGVRLNSDKIFVGGIDSHNFILNKSLIGETLFDVTKYDADGYFASECHLKSKTPKYIPKILSIYNYLR
jgi:hypothetical protein